MPLPDMGQFFPWFPNLSAVVKAGIIGGILLLAVVVFFILTGRWKRPIKYEAEIFEMIGGHYRIFKGWVFFKRTTEEMGYYVDKRKISLDISDAFLLVNGKSKFYLMKIEDRYMPLTMGQFMKLRREKDGVDEAIEPTQFLAYSKLDEYEKAQSETIKHDSRKYRWHDKLGPLLLIGLPIFAMIVIFFIAAWVTRGLGETTNEVSGLKASFDNIVGEMHSQNQALWALVNQYITPNVPPPG